MVNSEELIGTAEYLTLQTRCHTNQCRYKRVRLYFRTLTPLEVPAKDGQTRRLHLSESRCELLCLREQAAASCRQSGDRWKQIL
jgi:hypothetical protein